MGFQAQRLARTNNGRRLYHLTQTRRKNYWQHKVNSVPYRNVEVRKKTTATSTVTEPRTTICYGPHVMSLLHSSFIYTVSSHILQSKKSKQTLEQRTYKKTHTHRVKACNQIKEFLSGLKRIREWKVNKDSI